MNLCLIWAVTSSMNVHNVDADIKSLSVGFVVSKNDKLYTISGNLYSKIIIVKDIQKNKVEFVSTILEGFDLIFNEPVGVNRFEFKLNREAWNMLNLGIDRLKLGESINNINVEDLKAPSTHLKCSNLCSKYFNICVKDACNLTTDTILNNIDKLRPYCFGLYEGLYYTVFADIKSGKVSAKLLDINDVSNLGMLLNVNVQSVSKLTNLESSFINTNIPIIDRGRGSVHAKADDINTNMDKLEVNNVKPLVKINAYSSKFIKSFLDGSVYTPAKLKTYYCDLNGTEVQKGNMLTYYGQFGRYMSSVATMDVLLHGNARIDGKKYSKEYTNGERYHDGVHLDYALISLIRLDNEKSNIVNRGVLLDFLNTDEYKFNNFLFKVLSVAQSKEMRVNLCANYSRFLYNTFLSKAKDNVYFARGLRRSSLPLYNRLMDLNNIKDTTCSEYQTLLSEVYNSQKDLQKFWVSIRNHDNDTVYRVSEEIHSIVKEFILRFDDADKYYCCKFIFSVLGSINSNFIFESRMREGDRFILKSCITDVYKSLESFTTTDSCNFRYYDLYGGGNLVSHLLLNILNSDLVTEVCHCGYVDCKSWDDSEIKERFESKEFKMCLEFCIKLMKIIANMYSELSFSTRKRIYISGLSFEYNDEKDYNTVTGINDFKVTVSDCDSVKSSKYGIIRKCLYPQSDAKLIHIRFIKALDNFVYSNVMSYCCAMIKQVLLQDKTEVSDKMLHDIVNSLIVIFSTDGKDGLLNLFALCMILRYKYFNPTVQIMLTDKLEFSDDFIKIMGHRIDRYIDGRKCNRLDYDPYWCNGADSNCPVILKKQTESGGYVGKLNSNLNTVKSLANRATKVVKELNLKDRISGLSCNNKTKDMLLKLMYKMIISVTD